MIVTNSRVRIHLGTDVFSGLSDAVEDRDVILVTTPGMKRRGEVDRIQERLARPVQTLLPTVQPNPTVAASMELAREVGNHRRNAVVIGLGGGSALDAAKAVAAQGHRGLDRDWLSAHLRDGRPFPSGFEPLPLLAIPTTSGTGSEVTPWATIWDERDGKKYSLNHPSLFPEAAFLEPALTLSLPTETTVASAIDALSHAMESVWNINANPISDAVALRAISMIPTALEQILADEQNLTVRARLQEASLLGGLAISHTRTALAHSLSYPLTGRLGLPHGIACGFTLPEILRLNSSAAPERLRTIAVALGRDSAEEAVQRLYALFAKVGLGRYLTDCIPNAGSLQAFRGQLINPQRAGNNIAAIDDSTALALLERAYEAVSTGTAPAV